MRFFPLGAVVRLMLLAAPSALLAQPGGVPFSAVADSSRLAPAADARITYGSAPSQFAELRLPSGAGPHPVVFLLHGGCWLSAYGVDHVAGIAESMRRAGFAVFAVEYRRVGEPGAGVPGTFEDVRAAYDTLLALAPARGLDASRIVLVGHSAGGHLAMWLASEPGVRVKAVLALAAITDLASFAAPSGCGAAVPRLMGAAASDAPAAYSAASPASRRAPAPGTQVVLVTAESDRTVPAAQERAYRMAFPEVPTLRVPGGHFDLVAAWTEGWRQVEQRLRDVAR